MEQNANNEIEKLNVKIEQLEKELEELKETFENHEIENLEERNKTLKDFNQIYKWLEKSAENKNWVSFVSMILNGLALILVCFLISMR